MSLKTKRIIRWILTGLLTLQFLAAGVAKLTGSWDAMFETWGYSASFALIIGILEVLAVLGLYFAFTRKWASLLIMILMLGAAYTHFFAEEYGRILHNLALILLSSGVIWLDKKG